MKTSDLVFEEVKQVDAVSPFDWRPYCVNGLLPSDAHSLLERDLKYFPDGDFLNGYLRRDALESERG